MNTQSDNSILSLRHAEPQDITDPAQRGQHRVQLQQRLKPPVSAARAGDHHARWRDAMDQELQLSYLGKRPVAESLAAANAAIQTILDRT